MSKQLIITIDGPNAVGKTAAARSLARLLGYKHVNTGAIYRAVAYASLAKGLSARDLWSILQVTREIEISFEASGAILVNGRDLTRELYTARTLSFTSEIAELAPVREALLPVQRRQADGGGVVAEGRDTGTTVFPDADWKFYLDADDRRKAERVAELLDEDERRRYPDQAAIIAYIREIDRRDLTRPNSPLRRADDAIFHDTTHSPTAEHDAYALYHYMFNTDCILKNSEILRGKLEPAGRRIFR
ncbi:MAG TPA: (d)CMP kinase [Kofleriaceae bacterium]|nr:(d)CMP kinase [Kofleriaceae bacterium]